jgi:hypothetical protein
MGGREAAGGVAPRVQVQGAGWGGVMHSAYACIDCQVHTCPQLQLKPD